ncbi:MAG: TetR/AcrR family transcriptional regulator [Acidobacteriota bacterium]
MARTPSKEAHEKVLRAVLRLLAERGMEGVTMDAIAAASGVSKATVYKHWNNKDALLIDVIRRQSANYPEFDSGDAKADLTELLGYLARRTKSEELARIWPQIVSYAVGNPGFGRALHDYVFQPRRELVLRLLRQASEQGGLQADIDPEFAMDMLIGPVMHRRFLDEKNVPADLPERVVEYFWKAFAK